jgi:polyferredoxin
MKRVRERRNAQKGLVYVAMLLFNLCLVILQLWLFVAVLENMLAGRPQMAVPAAAVSVLILAANLWMLAGLKRMERSA